MSQLARVKRKGQVTIPSDIRRRLKIEEGSLVEVQEYQGGILLKGIPPIEGGKVVGESEYKRIIGELEHVRRDRH